LLAIKTPANGPLLDGRVALTPDGSRTMMNMRIDKGGWRPDQLREEEDTLPYLVAICHMTGMILDSPHHTPLPHKKHSPTDHNRQTDR